MLRDQAAGVLMFLANLVANNDQSSPSSFHPAQETPSSPSRRRHAEMDFEGTAENLWRVKSDLVRHGQHGAACGCNGQTHGRRLQAQPSQSFCRGLTRDLPIQALEMPWRQMGHLGKSRQVQWLVQVCTHVVRRPVDAPLVLHTRQAFAGHTAHSNAASRGSAATALAVVWAAQAATGTPRKLATTAPMRGSSAGVFRPWGWPACRCAAVA